MAKLNFFDSLFGSVDKFGLSIVKKYSSYINF